MFVMSVITFLSIILSFIPPLFLRNCVIRTTFETVLLTMKLSSLQSINACLLLIINKKVPSKIRGRFYSILISIAAI